MKRIYKIYSTIGKRLAIDRDFEDGATLIDKINEGGIPTEDCEIIIAGANLTVTSCSHLPEGTFNADTKTEELIIYVNPKAKMKSGEVTRNEIKTFIQNNPHLKDKFSKDGRNWTQVSTKDLQALYAKVVKSKAVTTPVKGLPKITIKATTTPVDKKVYIEKSGKSNVDVTNKKSIEERLSGCENEIRMLQMIVSRK